MTTSAKKEFLCPWCHKPMQSGTIQTRNSEGLFFLPEHETLPFFILTKKGIEKLGGVALDGPFTWRFNETSIPSHYCPDCHKIVMDTQNL